jgi:D-alanyl-lipoteichoic acid acyltransferase DltB (MBOAT superfamily)
MLFNSLEFLIFFPLVVALYFLLPFRLRWILLLLASYYFYMAWRAEYALLLIFSTVIDYYCGCKMGQHTVQSKRKKYLLISVVSNLSILFTFKYFNFFSDSLQTGLSLLGGHPQFLSLDLLLPLGISFYTFQSLSYSIDVYQGKLPPETHFGRFALYLSFFPQLVAGPIERSNHLLPQFQQNFTFQESRVMKGLKLMLWGFFQKVVISDNLGLFVDPVYNHPEKYGGPALILATYFFAYQIFCDFAGYSNIAVGSARVLGFDLMKNFNRPYAATSIAEFWTRWHISLSTWFRDYLYIPLGGNRVSGKRWYFNIMVVFLVSGLWHGASWTFVIWGALHGFYMVISALMRPWKTKLLEACRINPSHPLYQALQVLVVFHLVAFAWVFFRAQSLPNALQVLKHMTDFTNWQLPEVVDAYYYPVWFYYVFMIGMLFLMETVHLLNSRPGWWRRFQAQPLWTRWAAYSVLFWIVFLMGEFSTRQFIYFVF